MGLGKGTRFSYLPESCIKPTNKFVSSHSGTPLVLGQAMSNPRLKRLTTARTREATTFPHIVFFVSLRGTYIQMAFYLRTAKEESQNSPSLDSQDFTSS